MLVDGFFFLRPSFKGSLLVFGDVYRLKPMFKSTAMHSQLTSEAFNSDASVASYVARVCGNRLATCVAELV